MDINYLIAFTSGLISFFAPCVLPLLPAYIGYITGLSVKELNKKNSRKIYQWQVLTSSLFYILGFSLVFVLMGTAAAGIGKTFNSNLKLIQTLGGLLIMCFALHFLGVFRIGFLEKEFKFNLPSWAKKTGYLRSFLIGIIFATAWSPCVGAVLGAILTLAATGETLLSGASLLFVFSLGISIPFILIATSIAQAPIYLKKLQPHLNKIEKLSGVFLLIIGFLLFNNHLHLISPNLTYNRLNGLINSFDLRIKNVFKQNADKQEPESIEELIDEAATNFPTDIKSSIEIGQPIGELRFIDFEKNEFIYNSNLNQSPIVFYFWASWLPISHIDMPVLETLSLENPDVKFIGVHRIDTEPEEDAYEFINQYQITFKQVHGDGDFYNAVSGIGMPVFAFVDSNGVLLEVFQGSLNKISIEKKIEKLFE